MNDCGYGLWFLVVVNTAVVLLFAASFFRPASTRDWRAFGTFSAFVVALFTEMYGAPLTIYVLSSWLGNSFLGLDLTHNGGHLWAQLIGWEGDPHFSPFHLASYVLIGGGFLMIASAWSALFRVQKELPTTANASVGCAVTLERPEMMSEILASAKRGAESSRRSSRKRSARAVSRPSGRRHALGHRTYAPTACRMDGG